MAIRQDFYSPNFEDMGGYGGLFTNSSDNLQDFENYAAPLPNLMPAPAPVAAPAPAPVATPSVAAQGPSKQDIIDSLTQQIKAQGTTDKWTGGYAADAAAKDMARILADTGITDINQFGKVTRQVEEYVGTDDTGTPMYQTRTEETFGNKLTGQAVPNTYSERQKGNAWGGTFEGKGNTGYRVDFTPDGKPVFYATGASSSDIGKVMPIVQLALAATGAGGLLGNALLGAGANQVAAGALGGALLGGGASALTGQDILKGALIGGAGGALSGYLNPATGDVTATPTANSIPVSANDLAQLDMSLGGAGGSLGAAELEAALATGAPTVTNTALTGGSGVFTSPVSDALLSTNVTQPAVPIEAEIPEMVVTAPAATPVQTPIDLGIDYSLANGTTMRPLTDMGGAQGIQPGTSANLENMGGAQGLTINVGAPSTTLAEALANFGGINPAYMPEMGGAQGLTYQTPSGLVTESALIPTAGLLSTLGETGINTATNIGSGLGTELASINTGIEAPTTKVPPATPPAASTNPLSSLTPSQLANILKGVVGLFGAAGAGRALSGGGGGSSMGVGALPTQGVPLNSQDYFNAIQQNYNTLMPSMPKDVVTPLANWYTSSYGA